MHHSRGVRRSLVSQLTLCRAVTVTPASYGRANPFEINPGISALRRINAGCKARARTCIRNQCKNGSAIGMCNDNHHEINIPCPDIANMAENIKNHCYMQDTVCKAPRACDDTNIRTHGQIFSAHKTWNVIVGSCGMSSLPPRRGCRRIVADTT